MTVVGTCPADSIPGDAVVPAPETGITQSSSFGENGPLGARIISADVPNPYYEIGLPTDGVHNANPVGVILEIHGGGWVEVGPGTVVAMRPDADFWRANGWETVNLDYRSCLRSIDDVVAIFRRVRQTVGSHLHICASGESSGGSLALVLAAKAAGTLSCVVSEAGITNIGTLGSGMSYPSGYSGVSAQGLSSEILTAFNVTNTSQLGPLSPSSYAASFTTPALLGTAINDVVIPLSQAVTFHDSALGTHPGEYIDVFDLPCPQFANLAPACSDTALQPPVNGAVQFVHGRTSLAGLSKFRLRELRLANFALAAAP